LVFVWGVPGVVRNGFQGLVVDSKWKA
jgi:hypothetical protein